MVKRQRIKSWKEEVTEQIDEYIQDHKKKQIARLEYEKAKSKPKVVKRPIKSQECECGYWLDERHYSSVTKQFYCPGCCKSVDKVD